MARRGRHKKPILPVEELQGPNADQRRHATYERDTIVHAETFTRATVYRVKYESGLRKLYEDGHLTVHQFYACQEIASVAELIERNVSVQCASLEARVDCSGSARNILVERLGIVRLEAAYTKWRTSIPMPRRMIVDMVLEDRNLFATARSYRVGWPKAKRLLRNALDRWIGILDRIDNEIDQRDLDVAHARACA